MEHGLSLSFISQMYKSTKPLNNKQIGVLLIHVVGSIYLQMWYFVWKYGIFGVWKFPTVF
jgi:hypothetical protein